MSIKHRFLKWLSTKIPCKIPAGQGVTVMEDPEPEIKGLLHNAPKYSIKGRSLFVYVGAKKVADGKAMHELLHVDTNTTFIVADKLFKTMYENIRVKEN